jgi:hypothetical protein
MSNPANPTPTPTQRKLLMEARKQYPYIVKWGELMASYPYYIIDQVRAARSDAAPTNAVSRNQDGTWFTTDEVRNPASRKFLGLPELTD